MLKINFSGKTNRVFLRFMISYLVILVITTFIGGIAYNEALKMTKEDAIRGGLSSLEKGKELLDARFMGVNDLIDQLAITCQVTAYLNMFLLRIILPCWRQLESLISFNKF